MKTYLHVDHNQLDPICRLKHVYHQYCAGFKITGNHKKPSNIGVYDIS